MRTVAGSDAAQPTSSLNDLTDAVKVEVADASDVLADLTEFVTALEYDQTVDQIVDGATVEFAHLDGVNSLAPLMTASPPVDVGRRLVISVNPGGGTYREVFRGQIDAVDWPERYGPVKVECRDQAGLAADTWIETAREYGSTAGVAVETVMQSIITDNMDDPPTLNVPVATDAVVIHDADDDPYGPSEQTVLDALRALVESYGGTLRWRHFDATTSDWKWTVFTPSRSKSVADHTFGTDDYWDVTTMRQEIADIRNVIRVEYVGDGGTIESVQYPREEIVATDASVVAYGRRFMKITEGSDSPIRTRSQAYAMARAAYSDLSEPDALVEITGRYFWPGELGVDLYTFTANDIHFSSDQTLAPMAFKHRIAVGEKPTTKILCRGKPSGGLLMWQRKQKAVPASVPQTADILRVSYTDDTANAERDFTITVGPRVDTVHVWVQTVEVGATGDPLDFSGGGMAGAGTTHTIYRRTSGSDTITFSIGHPSRGYRIAGRMVPYTAPRPAQIGNNGWPRAGTSWPLVIEPPALPFTYTSAATEDTSAGTGTLTLTVSDPTGSIHTTSRIQFYRTVNGTRTLVAASTSPSAGVTTGTYTLASTLDPKHNIKVEPVVTYTDATTEILGAWTFDSDRRANVVSLTQTTLANVATILAVFDTDTAIGASQARYRVDAGSWTALTTTSDYTATFTVLMLASATQSVEVQGRDADGNYGPSCFITVAKYDPLRDVVAYSSATVSATEVVITVFVSDPALYRQRESLDPIAIVVDDSSFGTGGLDSIDADDNNATFTAVLTVSRNTSGGTSYLAVPYLNLCTKSQNDPTRGVATGTTLSTGLVALPSVSIPAQA